MNIKIFLVLAFCTVAFSAFAAPEEVDVAVPVNDIARGNVITEADLDYKTVPVTRANSSVVKAIGDVVGKEARRALKAGEIIRTSDLKRPTLVSKGSNVVMLFDAPGMHLTSVGRALAEGGEGDVITVLNPTSYRKVEAIIVKAGTVRVGADARTDIRTDAKTSNQLAASKP